MQVSEEDTRFQLSAALAARDALQAANQRLQEDVAAREEELEHINAVFDQKHRCCNAWRSLKE